MGAGALLLRAEALWLLLPPEAAVDRRGPFGAGTASEASSLLDRENGMPVAWSSRRYRLEERPATAAHGSHRCRHAVHWASCSYTTGQCCPSSSTWQPLL